MGRLIELASDDPELATLRALIEADLPYRAARYLESERPDSGLGAVDARLVRHVGGDAYRAYRDAGRSGSRLREPPTTRTYERWLDTFPRPFEHWATGAGEEFGIDPLLLFSHMQIESHYHPGLVSYADAMGVLQLIQRTGQNVALELGETYTEGMMMNPAINVRYAGWYLQALIDEFGGQLPLAMCSYNAGGHSMQRWVEENGDLPFDAFVEEIPYDQSREYVKRAIGVYAHYLYLYADDEQLDAVMPILLPESIDASTVQGIINW